MNDKQPNDLSSALDEAPQTLLQRLSVRAVVVKGAADAAKALDEAGLFDPVSVPILLHQEPQEGVLFGDGITPNLPAILELEAEKPTQGTGESREASR